MSGQALLVRQTSPFHYFHFLRREEEPYSLDFEWQQTAPVDNPEIANRISITSILSVFWEFRPPGLNRCCAAQYSGLYVLGMIGFSLDLVWRIIRFAGRILLLIGACVRTPVTRDWKEPRDRAAIPAVTLAKVFSAAIGILCPPAAYKIDKELDRWMPPCDQSFYLVFYDPKVFTVEEAYSVLDLPPDASRVDVRERYRALLRQLHPDRGAMDTTNFRIVQAAYERLDAYFNQNSL
jgi:hypothetical protein